MTPEQLTAVIADTLMPGAPEMVADPASQITRTLLKRNAVVELVAPTSEDEDGTTWNACDGYELVKVAHGVLWVGDDILTAEDAEETAGALLAAARLARADAAEVPCR